MSLTIYRTLVDNATSPACLFDEKGSIISVNTVGKFVFDAGHSGTVGAWMSSRSLTLSTLKEMATNKKVDSDTDLAVITNLKVEYDNGIFLVLAHTTEASGSEISRVTHAIRDQLTHLPNKVLLIDRLQQTIIKSKRDGKAVALILCRMERFDNYVKAIGTSHSEDLKRLAAEKIVSCVRDSDTVGQLDFQTFAMVCQIAASEDADLIARKVLNTMQSAMDIGGHSITVRMRLGISLFPDDRDSARDLIECASTAMDHAKNSRQKYEFFAQEMNEKIKSRLVMENRMRDALKRGLFTLHYQPKIDAKSEKIVGAEGLIRWQDEELGFVSPVEFIPIAEETGLIEEIGYWVIQEACSQSMRWQQDGLTAIRLSVNVSSRQLGARDFIDRLTSIIHASGLSPDMLELEITESVLVRNVEKTIETFSRIRDIGCHLSIDDFGTGYSSLSYLTQFPITTLKIDRAFIKDLEVNRNTAEVAKAIIGLSHGLNLEVVAEGAETKDHVNFLQENGCELVQGFYYSKPVPPSEFKKLLSENYIRKH